MWFYNATAYIHIPHYITFLLFISVLLSKDPVIVFNIHVYIRLGILNSLCLLRHLASPHKKKKFYLFYVNYNLLPDLFVIKDVHTRSNLIYSFFFIFSFIVDSINFVKYLWKKNMYHKHLNRVKIILLFDNAWVQLLTLLHNISF